MNLRSWIKRTRAGQILWRIIIGALGGGITVIGAIALIGPGPGVLIVLAGLGILATEFAWAGKAMMRTKQFANRAANRTGLPKWVNYFIVAAAAAISIVAVLIYYSR